MKKSNEYSYREECPGSEKQKGGHNTSNSSYRRPPHPLDLVSSSTSTAYQIISAIAWNENLVLLTIGLSIVLYFLCMDTILYTRFRSVDFVNESKVPVKPWSPFRPLSMKLLMSDHMTHYVNTPLSEGFEDVTGFSKVFYFITPNMISFAHAGVGLIMARFFMYSDSLKTRRIGVLIGLFRFWLDALDGTVFRSHSENKLFTSDHNSFGYVIDTVCDTTVNTAFHFSIFFFLGWKCTPMKETGALPWSYENDDNRPTGGARENHTTSKSTPYSKPYLFWRVFCYGVMVAISASIWDHLHTQYTVVFMKKLEPGVSEIQSDCFHSLSFWVIIWSWKVLQGQAWVYWMYVAVFADKIWEFLQITKYLGFALVGVLSIYSFYHLNNVRQLLHL